MLFGLLPEDCAVPPKSDFAHVTQLNSLHFLTTKSVLADFAVGDDAGLLLRIEAHAPGVYRLRCAPAERLRDEKPSARAKAQAEMLLARQEPVSELAVCSSIAQSEPCWRLRSEEHTSELQSLMRLSYAVFCLKKQN